jgi:hypothetical protein
MQNMLPRSDQSAPIDLYIVGAGVSFPEHLTIQAVEILTSCRRICTIMPDVRLGGLPDELRGKCVSFWHLYQDKRPRLDNYRDITEAILNAVEDTRPLAWLSPGHPLVFDSVTQALLKQAPARGWTVSVIPGISCLDTLLAELGYDPASGLFVHDATSLVAWNVPVSPAIATVLLQPSVFGSRLTHISAEYDGPDLTGLRDYLLRYHAPEHQCAFVRSSLNGEGRGEISWVKLSELAGVSRQVIAGSTLFLPAAETGRRQTE